jgi:hypothetical protein
VPVFEDFSEGLERVLNLKVVFHQGFRQVLYRVVYEVALGESHL